jgi:CBS domain-containing protein
MRDRDNFEDEYERGRGYRGNRQQLPREEYIKREDYSSREGYNPPELREGYPRYERGDRESGYDRDRYSDRELQSRYEPRYEPRYQEPRYQQPRYSQSEYADRDRTQWSPGAYQQQRSHLRCRDIMTTDVIACRPDSNLREIARVMRKEDTGAIPVVDSKDKVIGIVTDRDIVVRILADKDKNLDSCTVNDAMTDDVFSVRPNDRVVDVIRKMGDKQVRRMIVTDDNGRLRGIISMGDIATEAEYDRELADSIEDISKPKSWFKRIFS